MLEFMKIQSNVDLSQLTTMRLGGHAKYLIELQSVDDVPTAVKFIKEKKLPWFVLGGGSNVIAGQDFDGVILLNRISGFQIVEQNTSGDTLKIGAGENWDATVAKTTAMNLSGVESMSAIPGTAGATPVQNVGAYGQEIADTLVELTAYDVALGQFVTLSRAECKLSYRNSIFKSREQRKYIIVDITLRLRQGAFTGEIYPSLQKYLTENSIEPDQNGQYSPQQLRDAVIKLRASKLPDPTQIPSAGSFFKNPRVAPNVAAKIMQDLPDAPHWPMPDGRVKLAAGWLIDQTGLKNFSADGFQIYAKNALVVTNLNAQKRADLIKFKRKIIDQVFQKFNVTLEQEPEDL
jgi:UDP-N-acetylmuramate dehydrogenase